jgi:GNAT superfamily N-acetyltransferase
VESTPEGERIRGLVELYRDDDMVELAVTLEPGWRGRGVAESLMRAAASAALREGVERIKAVTLSSNHRMKGLGRKLGARIRPSPDGVDLIFDAAALASRPGPAAERAGDGALDRLLAARPAAGSRTGAAPA